MILMMNMILRPGVLTRGREVGRMGIFDENRRMVGILLDRINGILVGIFFRQD